jgi:flavin-dependent dehydrogenase
MTDADLLPRDVRTERGSWKRELDKTVDIRARVELHELTLRPAVVPAFSACASSASGANWLVVGDAAAALDPLSGQGITNALRSAWPAAHAIQRYLFGDRSALSDYTRSVKGVFTEYLRARVRYYASERRWRHSAFWIRRGAAANAAIDS